MLYISTIVFPPFPFHSLSVSVSLWFYVIYCFVLLCFSSATDLAWEVLPPPRPREPKDLLSTKRFAGLSAARGIREKAGAQWEKECLSQGPQSPKALLVVLMNVSWVSPSSRGSSRESVWALTFWCCHVCSEKLQIWIVKVTVWAPRSWRSSSAHDWFSAAFSFCHLRDESFPDIWLLSFQICSGGPGATQKERHPHCWACGQTELWASAWVRPKLQAFSGCGQAALSLQGPPGDLLCQQSRQSPAFMKAEIWSFYRTTLKLGLISPFPR